MKSLKFSQVKFTIISEETTNLQKLPPSNLPNVFEKLMITEVKLPIQKEERTHLDLLYNEIISLLESKKVGWIHGSHQTNGQNFIMRLTKAIW